MTGYDSDQCSAGDEAMMLDKDATAKGDETSLLMTTGHWPGRDAKIQVRKCIIA
jgi:hypothetical protein